MNLCKWPDTETEQRRIDLFYHLSDYFDVKRYAQNETAKEGGGNLTWDSLVTEAKCQERVGKEYARFRRENGDSSTPSYGDPALAADAVSKSFKRGGQQRPRTPSGGRGSQQQCDRAEDATAVMARRELAQHGARSVTTVMDGTTTRQSAGRLPRARPMVVHVQGNSRGEARPNLPAKQRSMLTPWCLRRSFQEERENYFLMRMQIKTRSFRKECTFE